MTEPVNPSKRIREARKMVEKIYRASTREEAVANHAAFLPHALDIVFLLLMRDAAWKRKVEKLKERIDGPRIPKPRSLTEQRFVELASQLGNADRTPKPDAIEVEEFDIIDDDEDLYETQWLGEEAIELERKL